MKPAIIERGRGPEIEGSRITVYDVLAETRIGVSVEQLAHEWQLSVEQIELALKYIDEHREQVERNWIAIQERHAREEREFKTKYADRLAASHEKFQRAKAEYDRRRAERESHAGPSDRCEHPGANGASTPGLSLNRTQ
jgi:uncharacterized protein (DUF433 family)